MTFNQFNWNNYKQTKSFENFCATFQPLEIIKLNDCSEEIFEIYCNSFVEDSGLELPTSIDEAFDNFYVETVLGDVLDSSEYENKSNQLSDEEFEVWLEKTWNDLRKQAKKTGELTQDQLIAEYVSEISLGLFKACPEYFIPYLFKPIYFEETKQKEYNFNLVRSICDEFEIDLPEPPLRNDYLGKANYYNQINYALYEFRIGNKLSPIELCAFLYDYAPQYLENNRDKELPPPLRVWLIKAANDFAQDFDLIESANENSRSYWNGNINTKRGDILLMYCVSPRSLIHSIWRANSDGFNDPFFYYHNQIEISNKIKIPNIGFKELQKLPIVSQKAQMKAHLQTNSGGIEFTYQEFEEIESLLQQKGFDTSALPKLPQSEISLEQNLLNERDVETKLLEPLLIELGYQESDWIRQYITQIGTKERIIPDYIFSLKNNKAELIIEAKFRYHDATRKEKEKYFKQAYSYALHFQAPKLVIADKNGIIVFHHQNGNYDKDRNTFYSWSKLNRANYFQELKKYLYSRQ